MRRVGYIFSESAFVFRSIYYTPPCMPISGSSRRLPWLKSSARTVQTPWRHGVCYGEFLAGKAQGHAVDGNAGSLTSALGIVLAAVISLGHRGSGHREAVSTSRALLMSDRGGQQQLITVYGPADRPVLCFRSHIVAPWCSCRERQDMAPITDSSDYC